MYRFFTLAFAAVIALSGCKSTDEYAGKGDLVLSQRAKEFVDNITAREGIVAVSYDGRYARAYGCPEIQGCVAGGYDPQSLIDECEKGGSKCAIYSSNGFVIWQGKVTVR